MCGWIRIPRKPAFMALPAVGERSSGVEERTPVHLSPLLWLWDSSFLSTLTSIGTLLPLVMWSWRNSTSSVVLEKGRLYLLSDPSKCKKPCSQRPKGYNEILTSKTVFHSHFLFFFFLLNNIWNIIIVLYISISNDMFRFCVAVSTSSFTKQWAIV